MRRIFVLLAACLFASIMVSAQDQDFSKVQMKVSKVAGNVYMLEGAGGNIGASVGDDGIVIVDDQYAPLAEKIQAALKGITDKPVRFIINTHYHGDHTGGNAYFQKQAPIIAQDNVRKRLETGGGAGNGGSLHFDAKPAAKEALPILTFAMCATGIGNTNFWAISQHVPPKRMVARTIGYLNMLSVVAGAAAPVVTGWILGPQKHFGPAIFVAGVCPVLAALCLLAAGSQGLGRMKALLAGEVHADA